ncbi:hypothetical protein Gotur_013553, partial [Gossypium turneri]
MWENWYDHIPTREPTIVLELARRQIRVEREQRGPLNPKRRDDDMGPSTVPTQSPS